MKTIKENIGVLVGSLGVITYSLLGAATCIWCLSLVFGFLGLGSGAILFAVDNRLYILFASIGIILISFYFIFKKARCVTCKA